MSSQLRNGQDAATREAVECRIERDGKGHPSGGSHARLGELREKMLCPVRSKGMSEKFEEDPGVCALI